MKRLEEILKRCEAATPGPWEANEDGIRCTYPSRRDPAWKDWIGLRNSEMSIVGQLELNAEFIAQARQDLPLVTQALMKAVEAIKILQRYHFGDGSITREKVTETLGGTLAEIEKMFE